MIELNPFNSINLGIKNSRIDSINNRSVFEYLINHYKQLKNPIIYSNEYIRIIRLGLIEKYELKDNELIDEYDINSDIAEEILEQYGMTVKKEN
ncbi:hypothetical protein NUSPORA_00571 [Nucleospora cyclopteri]